jgi:acyl-CoA thioesterase-1
MRLRNLYLLWLFGIWHTFAYAQMPLAATDNLLVVGDSLSAAFGIAPEQGWVQLLSKRLNNTGHTYDVINASISGETTFGGLSRLIPLLKKYYPKIVIVELGANDGFNGSSLEGMRANLIEMITHCQQIGAKVLLLGMRIPTDYGKPYADRFYLIFQEVAKQTRVALVPFFLAGVATEPRWMQSDGIHPTAEAQVKLLDNIWHELEKLK